MRRIFTGNISNLDIGEGLKRVNLDGSDEFISMTDLLDAGEAINLVFAVFFRFLDSEETRQITLRLASGSNIVVINTVLPDQFFTLPAGQSSGIIVSRYTHCRVLNLTISTGGLVMEIASDHVGDDDVSIEVQTFVDGVDVSTIRGDLPGDSDDLRAAIIDPVNGDQSRIITDSGKVKGTGGGTGTIFG